MFFQREILFKDRINLFFLTIVQRYIFNVAKINEKSLFIFQKFDNIVK